ncbi:MAG: Xaa-Pro peptidase family protein [Tetrasphaera sp.]
MADALFGDEEYADRLARTQALLREHGLDALIVTDPANTYYLTGYAAHSFNVPQALVVPVAGELLLAVREIDAASAWQTTSLAEHHVLGYPESYVQQADSHPMEWIAERVRDRLDPAAVVGVESDSPYHPVRAHRALVAGLGGGVEVLEIPRLVTWVRAVKSAAEIAIMRTAARITEQAVAVAQDVIRPGVRQCDAAALIYAELIRGVPAAGGDDDRMRGAGGDYPAIPPLLLAGRNAAYPHVAWSDEPFGEGAVALELSGARHRYHAPVARTLHLGPPPRELARLADITGEGLGRGHRPGTGWPRAAGSAIRWGSASRPTGASRR